MPIQLKAKTADEYFRAAQKALFEERYEAALESIKKAIDLNPKELEYKYLQALIFIKQKRFKEAIDILDALILEDEVRYGKAYFDLAGIYREQKRFKEAISALMKAEKVDRERALLEQGFTHLDADKLNKAIEKFKELKEIPKFRQSAFYNLAIAYHRKMDYKKALAYAKEAIEIAPETGTAQNARFLIDAIKREMAARKRLLLMFSLTEQYDDNVILQPLEQAGLTRLGIPPSNQGDWATMVMMKGEYKIFMRPSWELSLENMYFQTKYAELTTNDLIALVPSVRFSWFKSPVSFRLFYTFGHYITDYKPYADVYSISPVITLSEGRYARSELMFQTDIRRYLDGITPDADHYIINFTQFLKIPKIGEAKLGYKYEIEDNKKDEGDFFSHEILFGVARPFILKTYLNVNYSYLIRNFRFTELISPTQWREDHQHFIYAFLSRRFGKHFEANLSYSHTISNSNICFFIPDFGCFDPYHWRKNVVSLSITAYF